MENGFISRTKRSRRLLLDRTFLQPYHGRNAGLDVGWRLPCNQRHPIRPEHGPEKGGNQFRHAHVGHWAGRSLPGRARRHFLQTPRQSLETRILSRSRSKWTAQAQIHLRIVSLVLVEITLSIELNIYLQDFETSYFAEFFEYRNCQSMPSTAISQKEKIF